jgi:hypothetical protein
MDVDIDGVGDPEGDWEQPMLQELVDNQPEQSWPNDDEHWWLIFHGIA